MGGMPMLALSTYHVWNDMVSIDDSYLEGWDVIDRRPAFYDPKPARHRSRGPQAKPKRKTNRVRLSRRTRRKHRRAA